MGIIIYVSVKKEMSDGISHGFTPYIYVYKLRSMYGCDFYVRDGSRTWIAVIRISDDITLEDVAQ